MDLYEERIIEEAKYVIQTGCTVRDAGKFFCKGKSTIHKDLTERLPQINYNLYKQVRKVLDKNLSERHIRGGNATKIIYEKRKRVSNLK